MQKIGGAGVLNSASTRFRRYPTVERRCKLLAPSLYHALPADTQLCEAVITKCSDPTEEVWLISISAHVIAIIMHVTNPSSWKRETAVLCQSKIQCMSSSPENSGQWSALNRSWWEHHTCTLHSTVGVTQMPVHHHWIVPLQNGAFFVAAPLLECSGDQRPPLIEM